MNCSIITVAKMTIRLLPVPAIQPERNIGPDQVAVAITSIAVKINKKSVVPSNNIVDKPAKTAANKQLNVNFLLKIFTAVSP